MKEQCICDFCGKVFVSNPDRTDEYKVKCFQHEVMEHMNGEEYFAELIQGCIDKLNKEYGVDFYYEDYDFNPYYENYGYDNDNINMSFILVVGQKRITVTFIDFKYKNRKFTLGEEEILKALNPYYIENVQKEYEGVLEFEDWCGGHGADDYVLNGMYMRDIMHRLKGKRISIKVLD